MVTPYQMNKEQTLESLGKEGPALAIREILLAHEKYFPDLLRRKDERIFEFYLLLLKRQLKTGILSAPGLLPIRLMNRTIPL